MLKRKAYEYLKEWRNRKNNNKNKEALLIKGARQVGKSFLVKSFGLSNYESYIEINFIERPELKLAFKNSRNPEDIYTKLSLYFPNMKLIPGSTLFFIDEIQNCGDARTAIKFLASDLRFDFIASGSLLGLEYGEDCDESVEVPESIPVGYEEIFTLYSLDFEEFLWAKGYSNEQINIVKRFFDNKEAVPFAINEKFESLFREYMVVGGMPEVVYSFINNNDYNDVIRIQNKIINDYKEDIAKHAKGELKIRVKACYDSIPNQLAKEIKKFQYKLVESGQTSRKYGGSIKWLKDSSIVNICYNVYEPFIPLIGNEKKEQFKLYINDTGLLTQMYGRETKIAIMNNTLKWNAKGGIYENVISELLIKKGYSLHYFHPDDNHELEFIIEKNGEVVPIEVKSSNNASATLNSFIKEYSPSISYKLINGNIGFTDQKFTMPHYMIMFL